MNDVRAELDKMKSEFVDCRLNKARFIEDLSHLERNIETMQKSLELILAEQAKMKGFIGGVSFVFAGLGAIIAHFIDKFLK